MSSVIFPDVDAAPRDQARLRAEYAALTERVGTIVLPDPGVLRVEGRDRGDWLHNLVTADVEATSVGEARYSLLLDSKAHVLADFVLVKRSDDFLLYTGREAHENLFTSLRRAIFREKVMLTDISERFGIICVQGPQAQSLVQKSLGAVLSNDLRSQAIQTPLAKQEILVILNPRMPSRIDILVSREDLADLRRALAAHGAETVNVDTADIVRVESGLPSFREDFDETTLAPEARLDAFIAENKGCYPGQETIARIRNLGHVNRRLVQFELEGDAIPTRGDAVLVDEHPVGQITSAVWSFARNKPLALGYTRRESSANGTPVQIVHDHARLNATIKNV